MGAPKEVLARGRAMQMWRQRQDGLRTDGGYPSQADVDAAMMQRAEVVRHLKSKLAAIERDEQ